MKPGRSGRFVFKSALSIGVGNNGPFQGETSCNTERTWRIEQEDKMIKYRKKRQ